MANGQIGGITPTLDGGDTLDTLPAPVFTLAGSGTKYVYAVVSATHTALDDWVYATVVDSVDIQVFGSLQTDDRSGTYYILLATVTNGVVVSPQPIQSSLSLDFADDSSGSSEAYIVTYRS